MSGTDDRTAPPQDEPAGSAWYTRSVLSRLGAPFDVGSGPGGRDLGTPVGNAVTNGGSDQGTGGGSGTRTRPGPGTDKAAAAAASPRRDDARYAVVDELGRGGVGVVFRARDHDLRRDVALKVLHRPGAADEVAAVDELDERHLGRFLEEAQVTGQLDHPGVVPIHELGLDREGRLFFTMRMVRGRTFGEILELVAAGAEGWTTTRALGVVLKVCEALAYAHHKGVVHRDVKPANIMVGRFGESYVMDWGLAKVLDRADAGGTRAVDLGASLATRSLVHTDRREATDSDRASPLATLEGDVIGTPAYMAPEQARGEHDLVGPRADVYSVGALLYQLLTGQPPYVPPGTKVSPHTVLRWVIEGPPRPVAELAPRTPPELVAICEKAMARDPGARYESMLAVAEDIQAFIEDRVVRAHRSGAWAEFRKWVRRNRAMAASILGALGVAMASLGAVGWVQAHARAELADKNVELGAANVALGASNLALEESNAALETARNEAVANEQRALASEREVLRQSYVASITAAAAALDAGSAEAARRYLDACDPSQRGWEWRHLELRSDTSVAVLGPHGALVYDVAFSPDGATVAAAVGPYFGLGGGACGVSLWDVASRERRAFLEHESPVLAVDIHPSGRRLLAASADGNVREWDVERGEPTGLPLHLGGGAVRDVIYAGNDLVAACTSDDDGQTGRILVRDSRRFETLLAAELATAANALAVAPDGRLLAAGLGDRTIALWELDALAPDGAPDALLASPDATVSAPFSFVGSGITSLAFSPDGARLVASSTDSAVRVWDVAARRIVHTIRATRGLPSTVRYSPDGTRLLVGDLSGALQFYDATRGEALEVLSGHNQFVRAVAFRGDGDLIASGSWDRTVRLWDGRPGSALTIAHGATGGTPYVSGITFSPDGRRIVWRPTADAVHVSDAWTGETLYTVTEVITAVAAEAFAPDGRVFYLVAEMEGLSAFDVETGALVERIIAPLPYAQVAGLDPGCRYLAHVADATDDEVDLYDVRAGAHVHRLAGHTDDVNQLAFTRDGARLVTSSLDGTLRVWDVASGRCERVVETGGRPFRVLPLPDGRSVLTSDLDIGFSGLRHWDLETGEQLAFHPSRSFFASCALSRDGSRVLSSHADGAIGVWDPARGQLVSLPGSDVPMVQVGIDPAAERVASIDASGRLWIWETVAPSERAGPRSEAARRARLGPQAAALVARARGEHLFTDEVVAALQSDAALDGELRAAAVRLARAGGDDTDAIRERMLGPVLDPHRAPEEYLAAFELAAAAEGRWPTVHQPLLVGGAALYRLGRHEQALAVLEQAERSRFNLAHSDTAITKLFRAMCLHALGRAADAQRALGEVRDLLGSRVSETSREELTRIERVIAETEAVLGGGR